MSRIIAFAFAASVLALPASAAERKFDPEACAKAVAPYLDDSTFAVVHVDLAAVDVDALAAKVAAVGKVQADALPFPRKETAAAVKWLTDAGARDLYVVVSLADVPERPPFAVIPLEKDAAKELAAKLGAPGASNLHSYGPVWEPYHYEAIGAALVGGGDATLQRLHDLKPAAFPELAKAFAAADGGLAQLAVFPPKDAAKVLDEHHADAAGRGRRRFQPGAVARLPLGGGRPRRAETETERHHPGRRRRVREGPARPAQEDLHGGRREQGGARGRAEFRLVDGAVDAESRRRPADADAGRRGADRRDPAALAEGRGGVGPNEIHEQAAAAGPGRL